MQSKNIFSTWLPCIQHWFSSLNSMQPFGQGWAFLPFNKPLAYFRAKMPTPALMAAYCFMRKTSSSCRATNYIQFFSLLQSFFSVYIHRISVILLNKRTLLSVTSKCLKSNINVNYRPFNMGQSHWKLMCNRTNLDTVHCRPYVGSISFVRTKRVQGGMFSLT